MALADKPIDLQIDKGARFFKEYFWHDGDGNAVQLAAKKARIQIRESDMSDHVLLTLSTEAGETPDGTITLTNIEPNIVLYIPGSTTEALDFEDGIYDLKIYTTIDDADEVFEGKVKVCTGSTSVQ